MSGFLRVDGILNFLFRFQLLSPGELCSPCVSMDENFRSDDYAPASKIAKQNRLAEYNEDGSSSSSLYSSFLNKSSDSSCNPDQKGVREQLEVGG